MKYSGCKEIDSLVRSLVRSGWTYRRGAKHGRVFSPDGKSAVTVPGTPSDRRTPLNFVRDVRRACGSRLGVTGLPRSVSC